MKCAVIIYHKNILNIYPKQWVDEAIASIKGQAFNEFSVIELNYGDGKDRFTDGAFIHKELDDYVDAMNFLVGYAFGNGYDVVFNTNLDDISHPQRFEKELAKIEQGYQLVSCNFRYFGIDHRDMDMAGQGDIGANLKKGHNVICHPATAMHRSFWDDDLHYRNLHGYEDLDLWQRAYEKGKKFFVLPDYLLNYRRHDGQVSEKLSHISVDLLIIATNKYVGFLPDLLASAEVFFMKGNKVRYCVFTDRPGEVIALAKGKSYEKRVVPLLIGHLPWPGATLNRYHFFHRYKEKLTGDYLFYIDADTRFVDYVGNEILSDLVAVQHCGFVNERGTYETREGSSAYIPPDKGTMYYGGGFQGGKREVFMAAIKTMMSRIDADTVNGITAIWHDESHWNKLLADSPPTKTLPPDYHFPENHEHVFGKWKEQGVSYSPKILLLEKNHEEIRE